jgi:GT2 family glycosyltransferase
VNFRTPELACECARALAAQRNDNFHIDMVLVDNGSGDGSDEKLPVLLADLIDEGFVTFVSLHINGGFGWANNEAILRACASETPPDAIFLLNPDCVPEPGALQTLVDELEAYPLCAVAGSQLVNPDGSLTGSAFHFPGVANEFVRGLGLASVGRLLHVKPVLVPYGQRGEVGWVTGASCLIRTAALRDVGLFDTGFFLYFEEVELMHRMRGAGWTLRHVPQSRVAHIGGASTGLKEGKSRVERAMPSYWYESRRRFFARTRGPGYARRASLAWLAGARIARLLKPIVPGDRIVPTHADEWRLRESGIKVRPLDSEPAITRIGDPLGVPPRWMRDAD